jgi:hypothetical protein
MDDRIFDDWYCYFINQPSTFAQCYTAAEVQQACRLLSLLVVTLGVDADDSGVYEAVWTKVKVSLCLFGSVLCLFGFVCCFCCCCCFCYIDHQRVYEAVWTKVKLGVFV